MIGIKERLIIAKRWAKKYGSKVKRGKKK